MKYFIFVLIVLLGCGDDNSAEITLARKVRELRLKGVVSGFECGTVNIPCPEEHKDKHETLGLFNEQDSEFTFMVNIPQSFFKQYFLDSLYIEGKMFNNIKNAVEPIKISILNKEGKLETIYFDRNFVDEHEHNSSFKDGIIINGKWYCKNCNSHFE